MSYKFIFTGGHHNSSLVVAKALKQKGHSIIWLGHKHAQSGNKKLSAEYQEVTASGIPFINLDAGKLTPYDFLQNLVKTPKGIFQAHKILKKTKPDAIVSFGSYLGATVSLVASIHKTPIYIHEQTTVAGKANLVSAPFAKKIFLTWKNSASNFPQEKILHTGLPLRDSILNANSKNIFSNSKKTLLVMGGKQGSHTINKSILPLVKDLTKNYNLIHQAGNSTKTGDLAKANKIKESLNKENKNSYKVYGYIESKKIGDYLKSSDLVISRSGAHTIYELAVLQKQCILIPFEHTYKKEQLKNAEILEKNSQATVLREKDLNSEKLNKLIKAKISKPSSTFTPLNLPLHATKTITEEILKDLA